MKSIFNVLALFLVLTGCSSQLESDVENTLVPVTVRVNNFSISQEEYTTRTTQALGDYNIVKNVTLAFFKSDGNEVYKSTQVKTDPSNFTTFGEFSLSLPIGNYTMVVLAYGGSNIISLSSATAATYGENKTSHTFVATLPVSINSVTPVELSATLDRIHAGLAVRSTDNRPAGVTAIRITTSSGSKSFNPTTGLAIDNGGMSSTITGTSLGSVGSISYVGTYVFLTADEQTTDVTIETLDAEEHVLFTKTILNVPLKRNRVTVLQGAMFTNNSSAGSFLINTDMLSDYIVNF